LPFFLPEEIPCALPPPANVSPGRGDRIFFCSFPSSIFSVFPVWRPPLSARQETLRSELGLFRFAVLLPNSIPVFLTKQKCFYFTKGPFFLHCWFHWFMIFFSPPPFPPSSSSPPPLPVSSPQSRNQRCESFFFPSPPRRGAFCPKFVYVWLPTEKLFFLPFVGRFPPTLFFKDFDSLSLRFGAHFLLFPLFLHPCSCVFAACVLSPTQNL